MYMEQSGGLFLPPVQTLVATLIIESLTHAYECERKKKRQTFGPVFLFYGVSTVAWNYFTVMYLASKEGMVILAPKTVV